MGDLELGESAGTRVGELSESARRRFLLALALVRDPVLLLVDDPTKGLEPLAGYQLMHCLFQYAKRYHRYAHSPMALLTDLLIHDLNGFRMILVGSSEPRSDIYQLYDRLTLLFFGEVWDAFLTPCI